MKENEFNLISNSFLSTENNNCEKKSVKNLEKLMYTSNFEFNQTNQYENSPDIAVLIKKKNTNFANNFIIDSLNKNLSQFNSTLQNKTKHNSNNSSSLKLNTKVKNSNNYFQTNRERSAMHSKQSGYSQDFKKKIKASQVVNRDNEKYRQTVVYSPDLNTCNKVTFGVAGKESVNHLNLPKNEEKVHTNSPKLMKNFIKLKSSMTMKNSIKNAYIEYINSKALNNKNLHLNINKKMNLNSSNPNSNNNVVGINILKSNFNTNANINVHIPQPSNNRNDKNMLTKNLTDKTSSKHENKLNDNDYLQANSENLVDGSNRHLFEISSKTPVENNLLLGEIRNSEGRYSSSMKKDKEGIYNINHGNNSKRESIKDGVSSNNSTNENFYKKERVNISPKGIVKTNLFLKNEKFQIGIEKDSHIQSFGTSKTLKTSSFKTVQKKLKLNK
jgi:hypothetical protein